MLHRNFRVFDLMKTTVIAVLFLFCLFAIGYAQTEVVDSLIKNLKSNDKEARYQAASAFRQIKDSRAIEPLINVAKSSSEDVEVRREAMFALVAQKAPQVDPLVIDAFIDIAKSSHDDHKVRIIAVLVLKRLDDPHAVKTLIELLKRPDESIDVVDALGERKDAYTVDLLIGALKDNNSKVRNRATYALGLIQDPRAMKPLIEMLKDVTVDVQKDAAWALERITGQSFGVDYDKWVKWWQENKK